jgi:hypothetical protein
MPERTVVHIVPQLPPPPEGVGSFALTLAEALAARHGIASRFLVTSPAWSPGETSAAQVSGATPGALLDALVELTADTVLLHYANYGYEARGCPAWLVDGLARWKHRSRGRLVTVFHEVHAMGPPWRSSFWLSPLQRRLAASLARRSDGMVTSMRLYRRILLRWVPGREIGVLPVFSTVGEAPAAAPLSARARRLIVFGGPGNRARAYRELRPEIVRACRALEIEEICDVGPEGGGPAPGFPVRVRRLGPLPGAEVSALLAGSLAGFIGYPAPFLPKSTIFAAYCAHGMLPVCAWPWPRRKVEPAPPFWRPDAGVRGSDLQETADRARSWYGGHDLERHAALYRGLLSSESLTAHSFADVET